MRRPGKRRYASKKSPAGSHWRRFVNEMAVRSQEAKETDAIYLSSNTATVDSVDPRAEHRRSPARLASLAFD